MSAPRRIAILASGTGSNMQAIARACKEGRIPATVGLVISNVPNAPVLDRARDLELPHCTIDHRGFEDRESFESALLEKLAQTNIDFVALAGFMRILTAGFIQEYSGALLNVHPSLLPKYPGLNTHQRALDAGDEYGGTTVHFVIPELDAGPSIAQARVAIRSDDDAARLAARVQAQEHHLYPLAIGWCLEGRVQLRNGQLWKDETLTTDEITPLSDEITPSRDGITP